jgi:hypothetical protein
MSDTRTRIAAALFQPVPGGYVYREPYRWPFGDAPHYLVNEDQKAALLAVIVPKRPIMLQVILWTSLCLMVAAACVASYLYTHHDSPTGLDTLAIAALTAVQVVVALAIMFTRKRRQLAPQLATLIPTDQRITRSQMRAAATNAMSRKQLIVAGVSVVFASIGMLINGALHLAWGKPLGFLWLATSLMFAGLAWYYFRRLLARTEKAGG